MFKKDLLVLDIESTGTDVTKHEIIQLAAILLDKRTLKEKLSFNSFVKPKNWAKRNLESVAICNISWAQLKNAPNLNTVLTQFVKKFGTDVLPTTYGGNLDIIFLPAAFRQIKQQYPYDYHTFNIWALCHQFMAKAKLLKNKRKFAGFAIENVATALGIPTPANRHDALIDCRYEAEILRKLCQIKF